MLRRLLSASGARARARARARTSLATLADGREPTGVSTDRITGRLAPCRWRELAKRDRTARAVPLLYEGPQRTACAVPLLSVR
jgi:hypothetical protein